MQLNEVAKTIYNRCHDDRILFRKKTSFKCHFKKSARANENLL